MMVIVVTHSKNYAGSNVVIEFIITLLMTLVRGYLLRYLPPLQMFRLGRAVGRLLQLASQTQNKMSAEEVAQIQ